MGALVGFCFGLIMGFVLGAVIMGYIIYRARNCDDDD